MSSQQAQPEVWKTIPIADGYEASSEGRIRNARTKKVLKPSGASRYLTVCLHKTLKVHRLVANAFIGPRPDGLEACHEDGDRLNNRPENLAYKTHTENMRDMVRHGRNGKKLTPAQVIDIRRAFDLGESQAALASRFDVSATCIWGIVRGVTWKHLLDPETWRFTANNDPEFAKRNVA